MKSFPCPKCSRAFSPSAFDIANVGWFFVSYRAPITPCCKVRYRIPAKWGALLEIVAISTTVLALSSIRNDLDNPFIGLAVGLIAIQAMHFVVNSFYLSLQGATIVAR
jgi:hypothetical protein